MLARDQATIKKVNEVLRPAFGNAEETYDDNVRCLKAVEGIQKTMRDGKQKEFVMTGIKIQPNIQLQMEVKSRKGLENLKDDSRDYAMKLTEALVCPQRGLYDEPQNNVYVKINWDSYKRGKQFYKELGEWTKNINVH